MALRQYARRLRAACRGYRARGCRLSPADVALYLIYLTPAALLLWFKLGPGSLTGLHSYPGAGN